MMEAPRVHVGILLRTEVRLCLKGSFVCNKRKIEAGAYTVRCEKGTIDSPWGTHQESLELMPASDTSTFILRNVRIGIGFHWEREEDQEFEGSLVLKAEVGAIRAINILPVEQYLKSVISSEMSAMNDPNLLKVHAIVSRSWLLAQMKKKALPHTSLPERQKQENNEIIRWYEREDHATFDVCADDHCQRYQGISKILSANAGKAVDATSGIVLTYNGEICDARFSKCCGGISESYENVWQPISIPYLTSVRDWFPDKSPKNLPVDYFTSSPPAFCNTRDPEVLRQILVDFDRDTQQFYRWKVDYTQEYLSDLLARKSGIDFGRVLDLLPLERGPS
nr:SpoIID/LytB domain-containing protein [Prolixibacteraceae bacterium]